jgi:nicotinate-nucleotide adenylyltransferase
MLGLLGGTFDPVHNGHLHLARQALASGTVSEVLFMPARQPPHKARSDIVAGHQRLEMLALGSAGEPRWRVSALELQRTGPSYTVDTLRELHGRYPGRGVRLILGADMLPDLHHWKDVEEVLRLGRPLVAPRPGAEQQPERLPDLLDASLEGWADTLREGVLDLPPWAVSSTDLRRRLAAGEPADDLLPPAVAAYIRARGLYGAAKHAAG